MKKFTISGELRERFCEQTITREIENDMFFVLVFIIPAGIQLGLILSAIFLGVWLPLLIYQIIILTGIIAFIVVEHEEIELVSIGIILTPGFFVIVPFSEKNWSFKYIFAKEVFILLNDSKLHGADLTFKYYDTKANVVFSKDKYAQLILKHV